MTDTGRPTEGRTVHQMTETRSSGEMKTDAAFVRGRKAERKTEVEGGGQVFRGVLCCLFPRA